MNNILVTGASGFIGKRLISALLEEGHTVYALVRIKGTELFSTSHPNLIQLFGDLQRPDALKDLPSTIDAAYYLMHSMSDITRGLLEMERQVAENFIRSLQKTAVKQIIYLSGISNEGGSSPHLASRKMVEEVLHKSQIPTTVLRASIIIGAGSASFEIIRDLVEKLPVMIAPRWINSRCQPISVRDVIFYLQKVLLNPACYSRTFDIGGPDVLTFKELLLGYAQFRRLKRWIISVPVLTPRISSYWLVFITSVRYSLAAYLVESMKANTICTEHEIQNIIPHTPLKYDEAIALAFQKVAQNEVTSTWMDSWEVASDNPDIQKILEVPKEGVLLDRQEQAITTSIDTALENIWSIGGERGWYAMEWAWNLRGLLDKCFGGVGMNRGRRHPTELVAGDSIDFWRVIKADKHAKKLILYAEMKLPGEAWLEFEIKGSRLIQTATFRPRGLIGRLYWYLMLPFHFVIFGKMVKSIAGSSSID